MDKIFFAALGASLTVIGATALWLLTLGRFRWHGGPRKREFSIRLAGLLVFVAVWLTLAYWLGWKPR